MLSNVLTTKYVSRVLLLSYLTQSKTSTPCSELPISAADIILAICILLRLALIPNCIIAIGLKS